MKPDSDAMRLLTERLLGDGEAWFKAEELDVVLSWLSGSERHGGDALASRIGAASEQPGRRIAVYDRLSAQLFRGEQLDLAGAHVDIDVDDEIRRGRYRRLMTAFHPDRFPEHADWLTSRSQAVLASYARFRKGAAPENRRPESTAGRRPAPKQRPRQEWPRERRSARLTPMSGPGPLLRLRTWLLGIENLQRRILVVLAVVCLVPVLYAYIAYKPYRNIPAPAALVDNTPHDANDTGAAPENENDPVEPTPAEAEASDPLNDMPRETASGSGSDSEPDIDADAGDVAVAREASDSAPQPEPEASGSADDGGGSADPNWMDRLAKSTADTLAAVSELIAAAELQQTAEPAREAPIEDSGQPARPGPQQRPADDQPPPADPPSLAATGTDAETPEPRTSPAEAAPTVEPEDPADPEKSVAAADDDPDGPALAEAPAPVTDAVDEQPREHIEELLAGYRTSFENGWLDEFLDHFTAEPRENTQRGRTWFRNNYGWLFDNTEGRRLDIDILDISRGDGHWVALARFEMKVDYPDRPDTRSTRRVRYTIEANDHDQLRIAAIDY